MDNEIAGELRTDLAIARATLERARESFSTGTITSTSLLEYQDRHRAARRRLARHTGERLR